jgi:hypothetical protein
MTDPGRQTRTQFAQDGTPWLGLAFVALGILSGVVVYMTESPAPPRTADNVQPSQPVPR